MNFETIRLRSDSSLLKAWELSNEHIGVDHLQFPSFEAIEHAFPNKAALRDGKFDLSQVASNLHAGEGADPETSRCYHSNMDNSDSFITVSARHMASLSGCTTVVPVQLSRNVNF